MRDNLDKDLVLLMANSDPLEKSIMVEFNVKPPLNEEQIYFLESLPIVESIGQSNKIYSSWLSPEEINDIFLHEPWIFNIKVKMTSDKS